MMSMIWYFLQTNPHGVYIASAYSVVIITMLAQWFIPWRRWQRYLRKYKNSYEQNT